MPQCDHCGQPMRPNVQFFDDYYNEVFYKNNTAVKMIDEADCLVLAGSNINTSQHLIRNFLKAEPPKPLIEINEEMAVKAGYNLHIQGRV